jgi:Fic/DOC family
VPDWDENSPQLKKNLTLLLEEISSEARRRSSPTVEMARHWQTIVMQGLTPDDPRYVGAFRGEPGLETVRVRIGLHFGVEPAMVAEELRQFERGLRIRVAQLDAVIPVGKDPNADQLAAIFDLCAWAHSEWVRIHPFANGNGRTARFWANFLAMRYGLPPFIRLRPRPDGGYGEAGRRAMQGDWRSTAVVFRRLWYDFLDGL